MGQKIAVVGAGIAGLCAALSLSRKGNQVLLLERDVPPPDGGADEAFFEWKRRGAAQFRHPHAFLGLMCNILQDNYPDLVEEFWAAGARRVPFSDMVPPELQSKYSPDPGDEKLWLLMCRRATIETVLRRYVARQPNVEIYDQTIVTGMRTTQINGALTVNGLGINQKGSRSSLEVDLVVDASGRTTKFVNWFAEQGVNVEKEDDDAEIVYYTRHYKLLPGVTEPSRHNKERSAGDLGYLKFGVFPGDSGHFAVIVCIPDGEVWLREAVKSGAMFDEIARSIPGLNHWVAADVSEATTVPFGFADIHAVWRHFLKDGEPIALNYFAVGDAHVRTNPLYGRGCSTGALHAHLLADVLEAETDPRQRAILFEQKTEEELRPIFKTSLEEDKRGIKRANAIIEGKEVEQATSLKKWFGLAFGDAIAASSRNELHVLRGVMRTFNLLEKPGDFLNDWRIRLTIMRYMLRGRAKNAAERFQPGPARAEMLLLVSSAEQCDVGHIQDEFEPNENMIIASDQQGSLAS